MNQLTIIVMGKTGAGKSTLINTVLGKEAAPTGLGQAVTRKNQVYSKYMQISMGEQRTVGRHVHLYDTVGLEIDSSLTEATLQEARNFISLTQKHEQTNDATMVWFCVNSRSSRFENYEFSLLKRLSLEQEIPCIVVITQSLNDEEEELEQQIKYNFPELQIMRVLAKDYKMRGYTVEHYGTDELLKFSIEEYNRLKIHILNNKLNYLNKEKSLILKRIKKKGTECVQSYANTSLKIGFVPGLCAPLVHGACIKMMIDLHEIAGISSAKAFVSEIFSHVILAAFSSFAMMIPLVSAAAARSYIKNMGESYLNTLLGVLQTSSSEELKDNDLMRQRIKMEIEKRKHRGK